MAGKKKTAVSSSTDSSSGDSSSAASSSDDDGSGSNSSDSSSSSSDSEDSSTTNRSSGQVNKAKKSKKSDQKMTQMSKTKLSPPTVKKKQKNFTEDDDDDDDDDKMAEKKKLQVKRKNNVRPKVSATLLTAAVKSTTTSCQKVASQTVNNKSSSSKKSKSIFSPENSSNDDDDEQQQQHGEKSSKCQKKKRRKSTSTTTSSTTTTTTTSSSVNTSTTSNSSDSNSSDNDSNKMSTTMTQMSKKRCQEIKTNNNKNDSSTKQQKNDDSSSTTPSSNNVKLTTTTKKPVKKLTRQQTQQSNNEQRKTSTTSKKIKKKNTDNSGAIEESDNNNFALKQHHVVSKSPVKRQTTQLVNNQQLSTIQQTTNSNNSSNKQQTTTTTTKKDSSAVKQLQLSKATSSNCQKKVTKCPLDQCDSSGHLTGRSDDRRHFTLEACPLYHNLTHAQCKFEAVERKKREEMRKRALDTFNSTRITSEQRNYLTHVKMLRQVTPSQLAQQQQQQQTENLVLLQNNGKIQTTATTLQQQQQQQKMTATEPDLKNFVADYDLKLFRDAQALSSETIEEALRNAYAMTHCTKVGTKLIEMGRHEMEVWYQSPYPEDYARLPKLYICQFCLRYMKSVTILERHVIKCVWRHPPGDEVYRKDKVSVWEVDGKKYKQYCQNLCLLAKFFLDHKTLYYDVEPFLFYIMTVNDSDGCHTIGYFSKEKNSFLNYNVSCILTLPPYQRQGYGRLLIDFSYLLTRVEGKIGSPEKPLSDLGLISYRSYWKDVLLNYLCARAGTTLSVKDISQEMAIHSYDIVSTLQALGMMKYWKGKHIILKKQDVLDEYQERVKRRCQQFKEIDPTCLKWRPPTYCQNQTPP